MSPSPLISRSVWVSLASPRTTLTGTVVALIACVLAACGTSNSGQDDDSTTGGSGGSSPSNGGTTATGGFAGSLSQGGAAGSAGSTTGGSGGVGGGAGGSAGAAGSAGAGGTTPITYPPNPCIDDGTCPPGTWIDVTPAEIDLTGTYGMGSVQVDTARPQDIYSNFAQGHGVWKSTDYGLTWNGPINTGENGDTVSTCGGYLRIPPHSADTPLTIYLGCVSIAGTSFWRSADGVDWEDFPVDVEGSNHTFYAPAVDPYDIDHLLMAGHLVDVLVESTNGGETWSLAPIDDSIHGDSVYGIHFIDTGDPETTRTTWLLMSGAAPHTWRTTNSGTAWTEVLDIQHVAGESQIYQPDASGVVYVAGDYAAQGDGVYRSSDYGATWTPVGKRQYAKLVFGTPTRVYSMNGSVACEPGGCIINPLFQVADQPGTGEWTQLTTPPEMTQGPTMATVTSDGTYSIIVTANYGAGLWRYVEPLQ